MEQSDAEVFGRVGKSVTIGGKEYEIKPLCRRDAREVRKLLVGLIEATDMKGSTNPRAVAAVVNGADNMIDALKFVPCILADWEHIEANAPEEELAAAVGVLMEVVMRPFGMMAGATKAAAK